MRRFLTLTLLALAPLAFAGQGEIQMYTAGTEGRLTIDEQGQVVDVYLDNQHLGDEILDGYAEHIMDWKFEPVRVDGKPARVTGHMRLGLVAFRQKGVDGLRLGVRSVNFFDPPALEDGSDAVRFDGRVAQPVFPDKAVRAGVGASLLMLVKVGKDGVVAEAATRSVWLLGEQAGTPTMQRGVARQFARAAESAAVRWRFEGAVEGEVLQVPVRFTPQGHNAQRWVRSRPVDIEVPAWAQVEATVRTGEPGAPLSDQLRLLTRLDETIAPPSGG